MLNLEPKPGAVFAREAGGSPIVRSDVNQQSVRPGLPVGMY